MGVKAGVESGAAKLLRASEDFDHQRADAKALQRGASDFPSGHQHFLPRLAYVGRGRAGSRSLPLLGSCLGGRRPHVPGRGRNSGLQHAITWRRVFPGACRYFSAWSRSELPNRTPPLHPLVLLGVAGSFLDACRLDGAVVVLLAFHCFLRTGEAINAAVNHVTWPRPSSKGFLALPLTKTGQRSGTPESVTI